MRKPHINDYSFDVIYQWTMLKRSTRKLDHSSDAKSLIIVTRYANHPPISQLMSAAGNGEKNRLFQQLNSYPRSVHSDINTRIVLKGLDQTVYSLSSFKDLPQIIRFQNVVTDRYSSWHAKASINRQREVNGTAS